MAVQAVGRIILTAGAILAFPRQRRLASLRKQTNRFGREDLRGHRLDAEEMHGLAVVAPIAYRQVTAHRQDNVVAACGEERPRCAEHHTDLIDRM
jgi:hypothetical protein